MVEQRGQALRQVRHVQRAGHGVEQADADQEEGGADRAHDQVLVRRGQRLVVPAHGDQGIG